MTILKAFANPELYVPTGTLVISSAIFLAVGRVYQSVSPGQLIVLFMFGFLSYTLLEYLVHRFLFHYPATSAKGKSITYKIHGVHHRFPTDMSKYRSPYYSRLVMVVVLFFLFKWWTGDFVYGFLPGLFMGYAFYLFVHFIVHHCPRPNNFFKRLWILHDIHHYRNPKSVYGVSSPLWDIIFGTFPSKDSLS